MMESSNEKPLASGAGIEFVLDMISIDAEDRQTFEEDAHHQGEDYYISRRKIQDWLRDNVSEVIPVIKYIHCEGGRTYELKSISGGHVAHTIKDVCLSNPTQRSASTLCQLSNFWDQSGSMFFPKTRMRIAAGTPCPVKSELPMFRMIHILSSSVLLTGSEWS